MAVNMAISSENVITTGRKLLFMIIQMSPVDVSNWPEWASGSILLLLLIMACVAVVGKITASYLALRFDHTKMSAHDQFSDNNVLTVHLPSTEFRWFQFQYLSVYFVVMLADWLQGPNMYSLYSSYGVDVGTLFLTGFASSAVFGTFLGIYIDRWGRKLGCIVFCVLEIVINLLEHVPTMPALIVGRILGGISTSLLFSAFESWMVSQHRKRRFPESLLASTFAISSWGNGFMGFSAGLLGQVATDIAGDIGPFQLAVALTVVALVLLWPWEENYGEECGVTQAFVVEDISSNPAKRRSSRTRQAPMPPPKHPPREPRMRSRSRSRVRTAFNKPSPINADSVMPATDVNPLFEAVGLIVSEPGMLLLGLSQAVFEGGVYTFVFVWYKVLARTLEGPVPAGLVMTSFMLAMSIGGMLFSILLPLFPNGAEGLGIFISVTAAAAMLVPVLSFRFQHIFVAFLVLEVTVGMFNSCGAILRSRYIPERHQSSVINLFRIPLNVLVVIGTKLSDWAENEQSLKRVFGVVVAMHLVAALLHVALARNQNSKLRRE